MEHFYYLFIFIISIYSQFIQNVSATQNYKFKSDSSTLNERIHKNYFNKK